MIRRLDAMLLNTILRYSIGISFLHYSVSSQCYFDPKPQDVTVSPGTVVVFQCMYTCAPQQIPVWLINNEYYTGSLVGHAINTTGLVVTAQVSLNGSKYQCQVAASIENGSFPKSDVATLTVYTLLTNTEQENERKGPSILSLHYNQTTESLYLQWDRNQSSLPYPDNYRLKILSGCEGVLLYVNISPSCTNLLLYGLHSSYFEPLTVYELQVCQDGDCTYRGAAMQPQNLVAINFSNPNTTSAEVDPLVPGDILSQKLTCRIKKLITISSNNTYVVNNTLAPPAFLNSNNLMLKNDSNLIYAELGLVDWIIIQEVCFMQHCSNQISNFGAKNLYILDKKAVIYPWDNVPEHCSYTLQATTHIEPTSTFPSMETSISEFSSLCCGTTHSLVSSSVCPNLSSMSPLPSVSPTSDSHAHTEQRIQSGVLTLVGILVVNVLWILM